MHSRQIASRFDIRNDSVLKNNKELKITKDDKEGHGLRIEIIKRIVAKYGGMVDFFEEKNEFGVQVILPINK
ncbi:MAG: GHKL domain-containing protein [Clostridia bacterium]|nr:GHKL domain-containing protein [Clostridia bacterium]